MNELSKYLDESHHDIKLHENISLIYDQYSKIFQVILLILFGIVCDWKKIQTILRYPIVPAIAAFCRWFYVPLVSAIRFKSNYEHKK